MDIKNLMLPEGTFERIEAGAWLKNLPGLGDIELRVRGLSSIAYQTRLAELAVAAPHHDRDGKGDIKPEAFQRLKLRAVGETIVLGWANLQADGEDLPFSTEAAVSLITNPLARDFAAAVVYAAAQVDRGEGHADRALLGN